jgi:hypothetical protein
MRNGPRDAEALSLSNHAAWVKRGLVVCDTSAIAGPPIGAAGRERLLAKPPAIVPVGVVIGAVDPNPYAVPEDPMTIVEAIKVVVVAALRKVVMIEPVTVTMVMAAVAIVGFCIAVTHISPRPRAIEVAARISGAAIGANMGAAAAGEIATAAASGEPAADTAASASACGEGRTTATAMANEYD